MRQPLIPYKKNGSFLYIPNFVLSPLLSTDGNVNQYRGTKGSYFLRCSSLRWTYVGINW